jgi:hypothetical protein
LSFVVGTAATASSTTPGTTARTEPTEPAAPWPVITIRLAGYVAFAVITGVAAFVLRRNIASIPVPMRMLDGGWVADYRFALPGSWKPSSPSTASASRRS